MDAQQVIREPVAIGRFYPQNRDQLETAIPEYLTLGAKLAEKKPTSNPWALLLPHAGYIYCGHVIAATLYGLTLPDTLILLCPNHTGRGQAFGVWPKGFWKTPFGNFPVDQDIVNLFTQNSIYTQDYLSHLGEHSLEVLLPFLYYACGQKLAQIVPICIGTHQPEALSVAAQVLVKVLETLKTQNRQVGIIVSSDMNHYEDHATCMTKDNLALERISANDPRGLLDVCQKERITMCGVGPTALMLFASKAFGQINSKLIYHTSSAETSGNSRQTVGYAGLQFYY